MLKNEEKENNEILQVAAKGSVVRDLHLANQRAPGDRPLSSTSCHYIMFVDARSLVCCGQHLPKSVLWSTG